DPSRRPAPNFWISTNMLSIEMFYLGWNMESGPQGFDIFRGTPGGGVNSLLPFPAPAPANQTNASDLPPFEEPMSCYHLLGLDAPRQGQRSDVLCVIPGMASGALVPSQVMLALAQPEIAQVRWQAFGPIDQNLLLAVPMDGSSPRLRDIPLGTT